MSVEALCQNIWKEPAFQESYLQLHVGGVKSIALHETTPPEVSHDQWQHLLRCASIFLKSHEEQYYDAGLRIVHTAVQFSSSEQVRVFAGALLANSANWPALELAYQKQLLKTDLIESLPVAIRFEARAQELAATINFDSTEQFVGNHFQQDLWQSLSEFDWVSASAPTSAGKSFLLEKWIKATIDSRTSSTTFYIVPTRALIGQVESNLRQILTAHLSDDLSITSLPLHFATNKPHNIFIYTQERYHLYLLNQKAPPKAELIIIDEAHKIGGGRRGVLLQQVLELSTQIYPSAKYLFASPSTRNPEVMLRFMPPTRKGKVVSGEVPTVNQNLFWISPIHLKPKDWKLEVLINGEPKDLGTLKLAHKPSQKQKLAFISFGIGGNDTGNVVYVNRASDAEDTADLISQHFEDSDDPELIALSELCEKAVHPQFRLRKYVKRGVAFHYGNIPQLIRSEVERLFSKGTIKYLVCTSTLIEGMNLACKNVFMRKPKRGMKELMTPDDFWNLAGRAGRWGKEFQGNIYCIDPLRSTDWVEGRAPTRKAKQFIEIATMRAVREFSSFIDYAQVGAAENDRSDRFHEQLLSYFVFRKSAFGDLGGTAAISGFTTTQVDDLADAVEKLIESIEIPIEIVQRNPGINPYGMNALYKHFRSVQPEAIPSLVPPDPLSGEPVKSFQDIFSTMTEYLGSQRLGSNLTAFGTALLVVNWMSGMPLARIIQEQIKYENRKAKIRGGRPRGVAAIIRSTMERVEAIARYEAPKYLHCYIDILNHFLIESGREDLVEDVKDIWMFLEFGVSKRTQLSLMALGLSRTSAMAISEHIKSDALDERDSYLWLKKAELSDYDLGQVIETEIVSVLNQRSAEFKE